MADSTNHAIPVFSRWLGSWQIAISRRAFDPADLQRAYDAAAPRWADKLRRLGVPAAYRGALQALLAHDRPHPGKGHRLNVLDCGVGTGALSLALADVIDHDMTLAAVDVSPRMLAEARHALQEKGVDLMPHLADVRDLPFPDDAFDLVMCAHALEHLADPQEAIAEMLRVLRPGGVVLALVTRRSLLGGYVQLKWRTHQLTAERAVGWLSARGIGNIRCRPVRGRIPGGAWSIAVAGRKPEPDPAGIADFTQLPHAA